MSRKTMVIVNPASGNGKTRISWPDIKQNLEAAGLVFDDVFTTCRFEATHFASQALRDGYDTIISVGGDGTLNEVVNGFFADDKMINPAARLGIIPGGTGGDFIRTLNYPEDYKEACQVLGRGQSRKIDVGQLHFIDNDGKPTQRYFVNIAGFGMDGAVVERVNRTSKFFGGFLSFLYGTVMALIQFDSFQLSLEVDGKLVYEGPATMTAVANGQYFGGSMQIAPRAVLDDGVFEIVLIEGLKKGKLLRCLPTIYKGAHGQFPEVRFMQGTTVRAVSPDRVLLDIDGEQPGVLDAEFSILPGVLNIIC